MSIRMSDRMIISVSAREARLKKPSGSMRVVSRAGGHVATRKRNETLPSNAPSIAILQRLQQYLCYRRIDSTVSLYVYKGRGVAGVADSQVKNTYALKLKEFLEHLRMKVKVVSRQKYGAIWAIFKLPLTPLFENNVQQYQWFKGRGTRGNAAPTQRRCPALLQPSKTG